MATSVGPVAGTKLYIGTTETIASPDDWVEIGNISSLGDISQQFSGITVESIGSGDSYDLKGVRKYANFDIVLNRDDDDVGQIALKAAAAATRGSYYNFRLLEADGGATTQASVVWTGEVFGYGPSYGSNSSIKQVKTSISIVPSSVTFTLGT